MKVAFDIDGVLANSIHRAKYAPDWDKFYSLIPEDAVIPESATILLSLRDGNSVYFVTSRPERTREDTRLWLELNLPNIEISGYQLLMRPENDNRSNSILKLEMCEKIKPNLIFEDDEEAAKSLYDKGFKVMLFLRDKDFTASRLVTEEWTRNGNGKT